jgi:hypothetical protein
VGHQDLVERTAQVIGAGPTWRTAAVTRDPATNEVDLLSAERNASSGRRDGSCDDDGARDRRPVVADQAKADDDPMRAFPDAMFLSVSCPGQSGVEVDASDSVGSDVSELR